MSILYEKKGICLRTANPEDAAKLAGCLRSADRAELEASHPGQDPAILLRQFINQSIQAVTLCYREQVAAIGGICPDIWLGNRACVWLLTGQSIQKIPITFVRLARKLLACWLQQYEVLFNRVDARYTSACQLIVVLGGRFTEDKHFYHQICFLDFMFRRKTWEEL